ncbi:MAG: polymer-forming cytoskeletal protein [Candidatus Promineifilaceae bacterium]|nr:polymer-forming cytoskeletal protein [Candidatus Promineifilaceae bacterium]
MKKLLLLTLLLIVLLPTGVTVADDHDDYVVREGEATLRDLTLFEENLLVEKGGTVNGNVTIFEGNAEIAGVVAGDVAIFDGDLTLSGSISGDLVVVGGDVEIEEGALLYGDCAAIGGDVEDASASISCVDVTAALPAFVAPMRPQEVQPSLSEMPRVERPPLFSTTIGRLFVELSEAVGQSLVLGLLALVVTAVFPRHLARVSETIREKPAASGAVGLLTAVAGPSLLVILSFLVLVTCGLFLPAWLLLALIFVAAGVMGWIALGDIFGRFLARPLGLHDRRLPVTAALGTAILTFALAILDLLPIMVGDWFLFALLVSVGLGATALTRFGTKPYPPGQIRIGKVQPHPKAPAKG